MEVKMMNTLQVEMPISALQGLLPWSAAFLGEAGTSDMDPCAFLILLGHRIVLED